MPIGGSPIVVHLMKLYAAQGFDEFVLAAGHRQEILHDYFDGKTGRFKVQIVDTGAESDTGARILKCKDYVGDRFMATYGDGLGDVDLHDLIRHHDEHGGLSTVTAVRLRSTYGTLEFNELGQVNNFREKPVINDYWINAGFFVFEKKVFDNWQGSNLESDVLPALAAKRELYTYCHSGFWKSMDTSKDLQEFEKIHQSGSLPWMRARQPLSVGA